MNGLIPDIATRLGWSNGKCMGIARASIHNLQGRNHSLAHLLLNVKKQAGSGISVSILVHSFVTLCTVRLSNLPGIKSEQIIPITPSRLWTPSSPCPTSSSAPRPHHIWRRSSEVND